jgi:hypothetical protein
MAKCGVSFEVRAEFLILFRLAPSLKASNICNADARILVYGNKHIQPDKIIFIFLIINFNNYNIQNIYTFIFQ